MADSGNVCVLLTTLCLVLVAANTALLVAVAGTVARLVRHLAGDRPLRITKERRLLDYESRPRTYADDTPVPTEGRVQYWDGIPRGPNWDGMPTDNP